MRDVCAIIYTSNTGFTRRYAQLLSRACALPAYDLAQRDTLPRDGAKVLYLGWLSAGRIIGLEKARRRWRVAAVCAVGLSPEPELEVLAGNNRVDCPLFYARGGYAPHKLRGLNKLLMAVVTGSIARREAKLAKTPEERERAAALRRGCDLVDEKDLAPLLSWLREAPAD